MRHPYLRFSILLILLFPLPTLGNAEPFPTPRTLREFHSGNTEFQWGLLQLELIEGDMLIPLRNVNRSTKFYAQSFIGTNLWPLYTNIPFRISSQFPASYQQSIRDTVHNIDDGACLGFTEVTENTTPGAGIISFEVANGQSRSPCAAMVGYFPSTSTAVFLDPQRCPLAAIHHELCHALGMVHTHSRDDRDQFVALQTILSHDYDIKYTGSHALFYDYDSIMHYGPYDTRLPNETTIWAPKPIGHRTKLSNGDFDLLNFLYPCQKEKIPCVHDLPPSATLGIGESMIVQFSFNAQSADANLRELGTRSSSANNLAFQIVYQVPTHGSIYQFLAIISPSDAELDNDHKLVFAIDFPVTVGERLKNVTCQASVAVSLERTLTNCFGYFGHDGKACNGHGRCVLTDLCVCDYPYRGLACETNAPDRGMESIATSVLVFNSVPASGSLAADAFWPINGSSMDAYEDYNLNQGSA